MSDVLPAGLLIDISMEAGRWPEEGQLTFVVERAVAAALANADLPVAEATELSLLFTDDKAIRKLNTEWRNKDAPTNVLSFPGGEPQSGVYGPLLGDIVFAYETVAREAREQGIEFVDHLTHLTIHGLLHLFDYDHQENEEAERMESLEKVILASIGIANPYEDCPLVADKN